MSFEILSAVLSSPIPIVVSGSIALCMLMMAWYLIPLIGETKKLREENQELTEKYLDAVGTRYTDLEVTIASFASTLKEADEVQWNLFLLEFNTYIDKQQKFLTAINDRSSTEILAGLNNAHTSAANYRDKDDANQTRMLRDIERMNQLIEQLTYKISDISDKQSQTTGILTGMSILHGNNKPL